ncbi:MAG TPA: CatB-related O-acetyltransferase [Sphingomonas sp.]|jgi:acetyltransferase-like isoleucine patch superfamily enzyme|nr:CatB-related O-acetyltransferase [Sphingomonas sp.]
MLGGLIDRARLFRWRRQQMTSLPLRAFFAERYGIEVGLYSYGCFDRWRMPGPLRIGSYCSFGSTVRVVDSNHPIDGITTHPLIYEAAHGVIAADALSPAPLIIEDDVWVGHNTVILPGCKFIGRGAIIGAGSIVTRNVEAYSIVAGNPAKSLRQRFDAELITALEVSRWWTRDLADLARIEREFDHAVTNPTPAKLAKAFA